MDWNPERARVEAEERRTEHWSLFGPYLSDREWGTVREDYSDGGDAWSSFPFDHAKSRAYRWGEDGIFGISDNHQRLCFAPVFWNERDEILKERFFGLGGDEGNHGEDVKELYYYLDNVPTHSYMTALYKYPQGAFPYARLREENAKRGRGEPEFELIDTGIFEDDAYFDIEVAYAKNAQDDLCIRITATNRGAGAAPLHVLPQLWYRNEWSWTAGVARPQIFRGTTESDTKTLVATHPAFGTYHLAYEGDVRPYFTENETNGAALYGGTNGQPYVKDAFDRVVVHGDLAAANPSLSGTKAALHYAFVLAPGEAKTIELRLAAVLGNDPLGTTLPAIFDQRRREADRFYAALNPYPATEEMRFVQRSAFAGMLWSKQFYFYVVRDWLAGDPLQPKPPASRLAGRNSSWLHVYNDDVISMPDTWEYPWFASWDLAFHTVTLALVDPGFAKRQLIVLTREWYMHPNGALPAYEWAFGDANPPVHAWAAYRVFQIEHKMYGVADYLFLERVFQKLLMNFTWWVNREDPTGTNVFMGGFLGLDNIGVFDRSATLPTGGHINQSDATSWMAVYALDMMAIALELAQHDAAYEDVASKFFEHFLYIAHAINNAGGGHKGLWDEVTGFYYDDLVLPSGTEVPLRVRSLVGLIPLLAVEVLQPQLLERVPNFKRRLEWFVANRPELETNVARLETPGVNDRRLLAILDRDRLAIVLRTMLDRAEFLSDYGVRSLSKFHEEHPYVYDLGDRAFRVDYDPAESRTGLFGGNSNWRGPIWFPLNYLLIEALQNFHFYYGDDYTVEFPTGSGTQLTLWQVAAELERRLIGLFTRGSDGRRPFNGFQPKLQGDPEFRDRLLFYEYFHGDNGAGIGASHQTGWTGLVAKLVQQVSEYDGGGKSPLEWQYEATPLPRRERETETLGESQPV